MISHDRLFFFVALMLHDIVSPWYIYLTAIIIQPKSVLALSPGIQKWFWLDHTVKTALSGKSNLNLTVVQSIVSFLWSQWWVVAAAAVWHKLITFTYTMTIYIYIYCIYHALLASQQKMKMCLFSAVWRIWRVIHINNPSNTSAHIQRRIKKNRIIIKDSRIVIPKQIWV